jgi:hypothetical protein
VRSRWRSTTAEGSRTHFRNNRESDEAAQRDTSAVRATSSSVSPRERDFQRDEKCTERVAAAQVRPRLEAARARCAPRRRDGGGSARAGCTKLSRAPESTPTTWCRSGEEPTSASGRRSPGARFAPSCRNCLSGSIRSSPTVRRNGPSRRFESQVARREVRTILSKLSQQLDSIQPDGPAQWSQSAFVSGVKYLAVRHRPLTVRRCSDSRAPAGSIRLRRGFSRCTFDFSVHF